MARERSGKDEISGLFFLGTMIVWLVSVSLELLYSKRTELVLIICGCCMFQTANCFIRCFVFPDPLFVNTSVSLLHSIFTSISVTFILISQWITNGSNEMFEHSKLFGFTWPWAYEALCISCGYFAYDQLDMLRYRLYKGLFPAVLIHHLVLLICFTLALYRKVTINYLILTLICELHSIFLHVRKIRRMAGMRDSKSTMVKVEWIFNWITFTLARLVAHILITVKLIRDAPKFGSGMELPLALFGMVGMNVLNVSLGIDLLNAFKREKNARDNHHEE